MAEKPSEGRGPRTRSKSKRDRDADEREAGGVDYAPERRGPSTSGAGAPVAGATAPRTEENQTPAPKALGDYEIVARLGGGGMADVYLAHKVSKFGFIRRAVIKRVRRSRPGYKNLQRMLLDEARATACFDHPNLVSILDIGEDEHGVYIALEYVEGTDLRWVNNKLRTRKEALPFELASHVVVEVLRGLHHAHTVRGPDGQPLEIVHRDVNPANVLVSYSGHVKLADFGVVRMRDRVQQQTEAGLVKGKYAYLAPEYIAGESCSHLSDIYAAGIMLFELLSGRECFSGSTTYEVMWKIVNRGVPMYRLEREGVPDDICRIVARASNPVPERRFATAQEMANALETWLMKSGKHATPWVLSVFFARHELFPSREEMAASQVVPSLARSVHAVRNDIEPEREWSEPTPFQQLDQPARPDVDEQAAAGSYGDGPDLPLTEPAIDDWSPESSEPVEYRDAEPEYDEPEPERDDEAFPRSYEEPELHTRGTGELEPSPGMDPREAVTADVGARPVAPPAEAVSMPAIDMHQAMMEGLRVQFPTEEPAPAPDPSLRATVPAMKVPEDTRAALDEWSDERPTPIPGSLRGSDPEPAREPRGGSAPRPGRPGDLAGGKSPARLSGGLASAGARAARDLALEPPRSRGNDDDVSTPLGGGIPLPIMPPAGAAPAPQRPASRAPITAPSVRNQELADSLRSPASPAQAPQPRAFPPDGPRIPAGPTLITPPPVFTPAKTPRPRSNAPMPTDYFVSDGPGSLTPPDGLDLPSSPESDDLEIEAPDELAARVVRPLESDLPESAEAATPRPELERPGAQEDRGSVLWSGKLEEIAAAEAFDQLTRAGASGSLEFRCGLIWKRVQLDQGTPIAITSNMGMELIGEHLVKARLISRRELDRALHAAERDGQPLTVKLLELGLIDRPRLEEELGKNLSARLAEVLEWRWGTFEFAPQPPESAAIRPKLDLARIIQSAVEARARADAEEHASDEPVENDSDQSRLKEAFQRARSIAASTGKGRVDDVGSAPPRPAKR